MTRKVLYSLPIIILMLLLLPAGGALAAEGVFEVKGAPYSSLADAITAVETAEQTVIQAKKPSTADAAIIIPAGKNIVLDLNGQTVTLANGTVANEYDLINNGTLTIRDTTADKLGVLTGGIGVVSNTRTGIMTMESGTLKSTSAVANYSVTVSNAGELTVDGGTIYNPGFRAIDCQNYTEINGGLIHTEGTGGYNRAAIAITVRNATVELHGGELRGVLYGVQFFTRGYGTFEMDGGDINAEVGIALSNNASGTATASISGGIISAPTGTGIFVPSSTATVNVSGGVIKGKSGAVVCAGTFNMTGGTVSNETTQSNPYSGYAELARTYRRSTAGLRGYGAPIEVFDRRAGDKTYGTVDVSVSGGTVKSNALAPCLVYVDLDNDTTVSSRGTLSVSGGSFINSGTNVFEAYYADGSKWGVPTANTFPADAFTPADPFVSGGGYAKDPAVNFPGYIVVDTAVGEMAVGSDKTHLLGSAHILNTVSAATGTAAVKLTAGTVTVPAAQTLTTASGVSFEAAADTTLVNSGTITNDGKLIINGTFTNGGTLSGSGVVALGASKTLALTGDTGTLKVRGTHEESAEVTILSGVTYETDADAKLIPPKPFAVGTDTYATLAAAIDAAPEGEPTVIKAVQASPAASAALAIPAGKNIVLDLNGQTVTLVGGTSGYDLTNNGTLTIRDSTTDKLGVLTGGKGVILNTGAMTMESGKITSSSDVSGGTVTVTNAGDLTVNGGTVHNPTYRAIECQNKTVINGGVIEAEGVTNYTRAAIAITNRQTVVQLHGGEIRGIRCGVIFMDSGRLEMDGGDIIAPTIGIMFSNNETGTGELVMSGGTVTASGGLGIYVARNNAKATISGGVVKGRNGVLVCGGTFNMTGGTVSGELMTGAYPGYASIADAYRAGPNALPAGNGAAIQAFDRRAPGGSYDFGSINISITGGTVKANEKAPCLLYVDLDNMSNTARGTVSVSGGSFEGSGTNVFEAYDSTADSWTAGSPVYTSADPFVSGGSYAKDPTVNFPGYIVANTPVAQITAGSGTTYPLGDASILKTINDATGSTAVKLTAGTLTVPAAQTLALASGVSLEVAADATLVNNGTIALNSTLTVNGTCTNSGAFSGSGVVALGASKTLATTGGTGSCKVRGTNADSIEVTMLAGVTYATDADAKLIESKPFAIGEKKYATLADAIDDVPEGEQTVIKAIEASPAASAALTIPVGRNVVLDLNGQTVTLVGGTEAGQYDLTNEGTLTIRDSTAGKLGVLTGGLLPISNTGTMTVESGKLTSSYIVTALTPKPAPRGCVTVTNTGNLIVNGGTVHNPTYRAIECQKSTVINGGLIEMDGTLVNNSAAIAVNARVSGVELHGGEMKSALHGVYFYRCGTFTMDGGEINAASTGIIYMNNMTGTAIANMKGGTVTAASGTGVYLPKANGTLNLSGGVVKGQNGVVVCGGTFNMTGGTVSSELMSAAYPGYPAVAKRYKQYPASTPLPFGPAIQVIDRRGVGTSASTYNYGRINVSITGGTVKANEKAPCLLYVDLDNISGMDRGTVSVSGGRFIDGGSDVFEAYYGDKAKLGANDYSAGAYSPADPFVSGGSYAKDPNVNFPGYIVAGTAVGELSGDLVTPYLLGGTHIINTVSAATSGAVIKLTAGTATVTTGTEITIPAGVSFETAEGTTLVNNGSITNSGTLTIKGALTNNADMTNYNALTVGGTLANGGNMTNNGTIAVEGELRNNGSLTNNTTLVVNADGTFENSGVLTNNKSSFNINELTINGTFTNSGAVYGNGAIALGASKSLTLTGDAGPLTVRGTHAESMEVALVAGVTYQTDADAKLIPPATQQPFLIGERGFDTLAEAIADVPENGKQTTIKVVSVPAAAASMLTISAAKNITLDLNGFTVLLRNNQSIGLYELTNNGVFTVCDTSPSKAGVLKGGLYPILNNGTMTLNAGRITSSKNDLTITNYRTLTVNGGCIDNVYCAIKQAEGLLVINDGKVDCPTLDGTAISIQNSPQQSDQENPRPIMPNRVEIHGGEVTSGGPGIAMPLTNPTNYGGDVLIDGGRVASTTNGRQAIALNALVQDAPSVTIRDDALVESPLGTAIYFPNGRGTLNIEGGEVKGKDGVVMCGGTLNMSGGIVSAEYMVGDGYDGYAQTAPQFRRPGDGVRMRIGAGIQIYDRRRTNYSTTNISITGGTVKADGVEACFIYVDLGYSTEERGTIGITGGSFLNCGANVIEAYYADDGKWQPRSLTYQDGAFTAANPFVTGGTFAENPAAPIDYVVPDHPVTKMLADGTTLYHVGAPLVLGTANVASDGAMIELIKGTLTIPPASATTPTSLTLAPGVIFEVAEGTTLVNDSAINDDGRLNLHGTFTNNGTVEGVGVVALGKSKTLTLTGDVSTLDIRGTNPESLQVDVVSGAEYRTDADAMLIIADAGKIATAPEKVQSDIDETTKTQDEKDIIEEITDNDAVLVPSGGLSEAAVESGVTPDPGGNVVFVEAVLKDVTATAMTVTLTYDAKPYIADANGTNKQVLTELVSPSANTTPITFRLPVPHSITHTHANVIHNDKDIGVYPIRTASDGNKYVELSVTAFSNFKLTFVTPVLSFITHPAASTTVTAGSVAGGLTAAAEVSPNGTAELKWYACSSDGVIAGSALHTGGTFTLPAALAAGTHYYLCQATLPGATPVNSRVARVIVNAAFVPVTNIIFNGTLTVAVNAKLPLSATVVPLNATNQTIVWSLVDAGGTGAAITSDGFIATTAGTAVARATIADGTAIGTDFTLDFIITVSETPPTHFTVTVNGGSGGGRYATGATVTVTANPPAGKRFKAWTGAEGLTFVDGTGANSATAKFTMPAKDVVLTATYEDISAAEPAAPPASSDDGVVFEPPDVTVYNHENIPDATIWLTGKGLDPRDLLITQKLADGKEYDAMMGLADKEDVFRAYSIRLRSGQTSTGYPLHLHFDLADKYARQSFTLVHRKADGTPAYFYATADENGDLRFGALYTLSPSAFMLCKGTLTRLAVTEVLDVPATGDDAAAGWHGLALSGLSACAVCVWGKRAMRRRYCASAATPVDYTAAEGGKKAALISSIKSSAMGVKT